MEPKWSDVFTADELAGALDVHAARIARQYGNYSFAADIRHAAEAIRDLEERNDALVTHLAEFAGAALGLADMSDVTRQIKASLESLSKLP